jgi:catechol 2,3-dioxygenase-like lactoylglutathione lyase family enzyme
VKVKGLAWVGVGTPDFDRALEFFTRVLGLPVTSQGDHVAHLQVGPRQQLEIFGPDHPGSQLNATPTIAFEVDNFATAREELAAAGVELVGDPGRWNGFQWQYFRSPDGHLFEIKTVPGASTDQSSSSS